MLPIKEELSKKYGSLTDHELLDILKNKKNFRKIAIQAVTKEIKNRNISPESLKEYSRLKRKEKAEWASPASQKSSTVLDIVFDLFASSLFLS